MDELKSGEPEPVAKLAFKEIKRIDLSEDTDRLRDIGKKVTRIVDIANVLSPPPQGTPDE